MKQQRLFRSNSGLTLVEVLVVIGVVVLVFLVLGLFPVALAKDKKAVMRSTCQNNLKQAGLAFRNWEGDHDGYPMQLFTNANGVREPLTGSNVFRCFQTMSNELNNPKLLVCPADDRSQATDFAYLSNTNISYFLGPDVDETYPAVWLAGDRNLITNGVPVVPGLVVIKAGVTVGWAATMHMSAGNVLLSDGSVQQIGNAGLRQLSGTNVNRLAIP